MVAAVRALRARPRLLTAASIAAAVALLLPASLPPATRLLIAWDSATISYLVAVLVMMARSDVKQMRSRAAMEDEGAISILVGTSLAAVASLGAIAIELHGAAAVAVGGKFARIALAGLTILCSWLFVNVSFALHYAHEFYGEGRDKQVGGLQFPRHGYEPDYWDFLYFAANLGAAAQTSDVTITSPRMRRLVLAHTILSFLFNTTILALAVNVGASLLPAIQAG
jgi:uncharacterized membrane protein